MDNLILGLNRISAFFIILALYISTILYTSKKIGLVNYEILKVTVLNEFYENNKKIAS